MKSDIVCLNIKAMYAKNDKEKQYYISRMLKNIPICILYNVYSIYSNIFFSGWFLDNTGIYIKYL